MTSVFLLVEQIRIVPFVRSVGGGSGHARTLGHLPISRRHLWSLSDMFPAPDTPPPLTVSGSTPPGSSAAAASGGRGSRGGRKARRQRQRQLQQVAFRSLHFSHSHIQRQPTRNFQQPQDLSLSPQPSVFNFSPSIASAFLRSAALRQESDENADRTELTIVSSNLALFPFPVRLMSMTI